MLPLKPASWSSGNVFDLEQDVGGSNRKQSCQQVASSDRCDIRKELRCPRAQRHENGPRKPVSANNKRLIWIRARSLSNKIRTRLIKNNDIFEVILHYY